MLDVKSVAKILQLIFYRHCIWLKITNFADETLSDFAENSRLGIYYRLSSKVQKYYYWSRLFWLVMLHIQMANIFVTYHASIMPTIKRICLQMFRRPYMRNCSMISSQIIEMSSTGTILICWPRKREREREMFLPGEESLLKHDSTVIMSYVSLCPSWIAEAGLFWLIP